MRLRLKLHKGKGRQPWRLVLVAGNGEPLVTSEGYVTKWNARRAAKKNFPGLMLEEDIA